MHWGLTVIAVVPDLKLSGFLVFVLVPIFTITFPIDNNAILIYWYILVGGWPTPLKNMSSSVGMMTFPIYGKKTKMIQTTNQNKLVETLGVLIFQEFPPHGQGQYHRFWSKSCWMPHFGIVATPTSFHTCNYVQKFKHWEQLRLQYFTLLSYFFIVSPNYTLWNPTKYSVIPLLWNPTNYPPVN